MRVDFSRYTTAGFDRGASRACEAAWILLSFPLFRLPLKLSGLKCALLRLFGAKIGQGVVIKPRVSITFPWKLTLGNNVWIGDEVYILNLAPVTIGDNVCISQRSFLCTGNHNYTSPAFDLIVKPIYVNDGAWIGAGSWVGPGVRVGEHAVLTMGSVATKDLSPFGIFQGNPAKLIKTRELQPSSTVRSS